MKITKFWAKGYRSLRNVEMNDLGEFNVLYGPNGSGKSNILAGIRTLIDIAQSSADHYLGKDPSYSCDELLNKKIISRKDFFGGETTIVLGAHFIALEVPPNPPEPGDIEVEVEIDWKRDHRPKLSMHVRYKGQDIHWYQDFDSILPRVTSILNRLLPDDYHIVSANRFLFREPNQGGSIPALLRAGFLQRALLAAQHSPRRETRNRLEEFRSLLMGPPLHRPPFDLVINEEDETAEVRERLPLPNHHDLAIPLDAAGLGVAQMYMILAQIMLSGARSLAIEEPEAHLHAPTSGVHLRELLQRLVHERFIDQLFIATHSNLFDLDPAWYWDVSLVDGETRVERRPLDDIDAKHLYEPGPAKHALALLLRYAPPDEVVFQRPGGAPVTAHEMMGLLQRDDETALHFLRNLHGAALRVLRLDAHRRGSAT